MSRAQHFISRPGRGRARQAALGVLQAVALATGMGLTAVHAQSIAALAQPAAAMPERAPAASVTEAAPLASAITLGMDYVVPPHVPGAKVRTPEGLAPLLVEHLAREVPVQPVPARTSSGTAGETAATDAPDALLVAVDASEVGAGARVIPTGYRAGIMGIMRTDTDIRRWDDLRGRIVCLTEGSGLAGQLQARYGAIEKVFRAPADALLDLRIGGCDAAVHDSTMLEALLAFPEWQKFSARLPVQQERDLAFVVNRDDPALVQALQSRVRQWQKADLPAKLTRQSANDIAFEVYLDQEAPDCH